MKYYRVDSPDWSGFVSFNGEGFACLPCSEQLLWLPRQKWHYSQFTKWIEAKRYGLTELEGLDEIENSVRSGGQPSS